MDTGVLIKLYATEANSADAVRLVAQRAGSLPFTFWQEIEAKTALRTKVFRKELLPTDLAAALRRLESDVSDNFLTRVYPSLAEVIEEAEKLSERYVAGLGCRTLDILHVAAALVLNVDSFLTFAVRQAALADAAGLAVYTG